MVIATEENQTAEKKQTPIKSSNGANGTKEASAITIQAPEIEQPQLPEKVFFFLATIINKVRSAQGFNIYSPDEAEPVIYTWFELLEYHEIPLPDLQDMFLFASDRRIARIQNNLPPPDFTIELMIALYDEMVTERRDRQIKKRRTLSPTARSQCEKCNGTCSEIVPGKGARPCTNGCRKN